MAGELRLQKCDLCGSVRHPPTSACGACGGEGWTIIVSGLDGIVHSWVIPRIPDLPSPPAGTHKIIVLVDLPQGVRVLGHYNAQDGERPDIGERVRGDIGAFGEFPILLFKKEGEPRLA